LSSSPTSRSHLPLPTPANRTLQLDHHTSLTPVPQRHPSAHRAMYAQSESSAVLQMESSEQVPLPSDERPALMLTSVSHG
jgi:hypothetical protein